MLSTKFLSLFFVSSVFGEEYMEDNAVIKFGEKYLENVWDRHWLNESEIMFACAGLTGLYEFDKLPAVIQYEYDGTPSMVNTDLSVKENWELYSQAKRNTDQYNGQCILYMVPAGNHWERLVLSESEDLSEDGKPVSFRLIRKTTEDDGFCGAHASFGTPSKQELKYKTDLATYKKHFATALAEARNGNQHAINLLTNAFEPMFREVVVGAQWNAKGLQYFRPQSSTGRTIITQWNMIVKEFFKLFTEEAVGEWLKEIPAKEITANKSVEEAIANHPGKANGGNKSDTDSDSSEARSRSGSNKGSESGEGEEEDNTPMTKQEKGLAGLLSQSNKRDLMNVMGSLKPGCKDAGEFIKWANKGDGSSKGRAFLAKKWEQLQLELIMAECS